MTHITIGCLIWVRMPFPSAIGMLRSNDSILGSTTLEKNETKGLPGLFKEPNLKDYD